MNKVAYNDDAQVTELEIVKRYCTMPRVEVVIEGVKDERLDRE